MLFKVTSNDIFEDNPELKSNTILSQCSSKDLKYVFLTYDYESPLRKMPMDKRKEKACIDAGHNLDSDGKRLNVRARQIMEGKKKVVNDAIEEFNRLQYDSDREFAIALRNQVTQFKDFFNKENKNAQELKTAMAMIKDMPEIVKKLKEVEEILKLRDEDAVEQEEELSTIDEVNSED